MDSSSSRPDEALESKLDPSLLPSSTDDHTQKSLIPSAPSTTRSSRDPSLATENNNATSSTAAVTLQSAVFTSGSVTPQNQATSSGTNGPLENNTAVNGVGKVDNQKKSQRSSSKGDIRDTADGSKGIAGTYAVDGKLSERQTADVVSREGSAQGTAKDPNTSTSTYQPPSGAHFERSQEYQRPSERGSHNQPPHSEDLRSQAAYPYSAASTAVDKGISPSTAVDPSWPVNPIAPSQLLKRSPNIDRAINTRKLPQLPGFEQDEERDVRAGYPRNQDSRMQQNHGRAHDQQGGHVHASGPFDSARKSFGGQDGLGVYDARNDPAASGAAGGQGGMGMVGMVQQYLDHGRPPPPASTPGQDYRYSDPHYSAQSQNPYPYFGSGYPAPPNSAASANYPIPPPHAPPSSYPPYNSYNPGYPPNQSRSGSDAGNTGYPPYPVPGYPSGYYGAQGYPPGVPPPSAGPYPYGGPGPSSGMTSYHPAHAHPHTGQTSSGSNSPHPGSGSAKKKAPKKRKSLGDGTDGGSPEEIDERPIGEAGTFVACTKCRHRKIKCGGQRPICLSCQKKGTECVYDVQVKRRGPDKNPGGRVKNREARAAMDGKQSMDRGDGNDHNSQASGQGMISHRGDGLNQIDQSHEQLSSGASSRKHSEVGAYGHEMGGGMGAGLGSGFQPALQQAPHNSNSSTNNHGSVRSTSDASGFQHISNGYNNHYQNQPGHQQHSASYPQHPVVSREGSLVTLPPTTTTSQPSSAGFEFPSNFSSASGSHVSQMTWSPAEAYGHIPPNSHSSGTDVLPGQWQPHPTPLSASPVTVYRNSGQWNGSAPMDIPHSVGHGSNHGHSHMQTGSNSVPHSKDMAFAVVAVGASPHRHLINTLGDTAPVHDRRSFETMLSQQRTTNSGGEMRLKTEAAEWMPMNGHGHGHGQHVPPPRHVHSGMGSRDPSPRGSMEATRVPA